METTDSQNSAITGINIYKKFSFRKKVNWILNGINITIPTGKIFSLLGESGCGKTTLIKCIIGKSSIDRGVLKVMGEEPKTGPLIGYMPQSISLSDNLTVSETLWLYGKVTGMCVEKSSERADFLLSLLSMTEHRNTKINNLSGGEKRRVSFAVALLHEAPLIILDEPTVGVDPVLRQVIWQYLKHIVTYSNCTVLLTTHYIDEAKHSDYVSFLHDGQIRECSNPISLLEKYNSSTLEQIFLQICQSNSYNDGSQLVCDDVKLTDSPNNLASSNSYKKRCLLRSEKTKSKCMKILQCQHLLTLVQMWKFELFDSPRVIICQFLLPMILLLLIPIALNEIPKNVNIAIVNRDLGNLGMEFVNIMDSSIYDKKIYDNYEKAVNDSQFGKVIGVIMIPENFTNAFIKKFNNDSNQDKVDMGSSISIALDNLIITNIFIMPSNLLLTYQNFVKSKQVIGFNGDLPIKFTNDMSQNQDVRTTTYITPGILLSICVILFSSISGIILTVANDRNQLERLNITGVPSSAIAVSLALFQTILALPFVALTVTVVCLINGVQCNGSIFILILIIFTQAICGIYLGLFISSISLNGTMLNIINCVVFFLMFLLQGATRPVNVQLEYQQIISWKGPSASAIEAFRGVLNYGWTFSQPMVVDAFLTSGVWILVTLTTSVIIFSLRE